MSGLHRWLGIVLLACAWLLALPVQARPHVPWAFASAILGAALLALPGRGGRRTWLASVAMAGSAAAAQAVVTPLLLVGAARFHTMSWLAPVPLALLSACGFRVFREGEVLHVQHGGELLALSVTAEKLGALPLVWIVVAGAVCIAWTRQAGRARAMVSLVAVAASYATLRFTALAVLFMHHSEPGPGEPAGAWSIAWFQDPRLVLASFLPLALLLASFVSLDAPAGGVLERVTLSRRAIAAGALASLSAAALVFAFQLQDPGRRKSGRVAIDEFHSPRWESAARPLSVDWFGRDAVYNYATLVALLESHYEVVVERGARWTDAALADVDVLVVKTPTVAYEPGEIEAIDRFVSRGGGLFLIGDHTNLLGMADHLNAIAGRFGLGFRLDAANRLDDGGFHTFRPHPLFPHPVTAHVPEVEFMTSCTLEVSVAGEAVILGMNTFSDPLDYSAPSFFGNVVPDGDDDFGLHVLAAARKVERGRVLAFSDGTVFSSFALLYPGRAEFLLGAVEWLNRENRGGYRANLAALGAAGLLLLALSFLLARSGATLSLAARAVPLPALAGALLAALVAAHRIRADHLPPPPHAPVVDVAFASDGFDFHLPPAVVASPYPASRSFDAFFVSAQRVGLFPRVWALGRACEEAEAIAAVNPCREYQPREVRRLEAFVRGGGRLLVLDSAQNAASSANQLIEPFGLRIIDAGRAEQNQYADPRWLEEHGFAVEDLTGSALEFGPIRMTPITQSLSIPSLTLLGGSALFQTEDGRTLAVAKAHGRGLVVIVVDSVALSRAAMGETTAACVPGDPAWEAHRLAFRLWRDVLGFSPTVAELEPPGGGPAAPP